MSGFFSALAKFANELDQGSLLSDVGFHTVRIFIEHSAEVLFLLIFDEYFLQKYQSEKIRVLMKGTLASVKSVFQAFFGTKEISILKNPLKFKEVQNTLNDMASTIDRILYKSYRETSSILDI